MVVLRSRRSPFRTKEPRSCSPFAPLSSLSLCHFSHSRSFLSYCDAPGFWSSGRHMTPPAGFKVPGNIVNQKGNYLYRQESFPVACLASSRDKLTMLSLQFEQCYACIVKYIVTHQTTCDSLLTRKQRPCRLCRCLKCSAGLPVTCTSNVEPVSTTTVHTHVLPWERKK